MPSLFEKIYGVEAAAAIANSIGDISEGMSYQKIEETYGFLDQLLAQEKKDRFRKAEWGPDFEYHAHHRPPGMTEDGMERHRLLTTAIIEKGGRITVEDLAKVWLRDIDPNKFGYLMGPQDQRIYYALKAGIPPWETGRYASWPAFIGTSKMIVPVGSINACDPEQAALDAHNIARIKDMRGVPGNYANEVAAAIAGGVAEGLRPSASVDSIIEVCLGQLSHVPRAEVELGLSWAKEAKDWREMRPKYAEKYQGQRASNAVEVLSGALALFYWTKGDPKESILCCVNFGRESDCRAYVAGAFATAIHGIDSLPEEWVQTVSEEIVSDPYTVSKRTPKEAAEGIYQALLKAVERSKGRVAEIDQQVASQLSA